MGGGRFSGNATATLVVGWPVWSARLADPRDRHIVDRSLSLGAMEYTCATACIPQTRSPGNGTSASHPSRDADVLLVLLVYGRRFSGVSPCATTFGALSVAALGRYLAGNFGAVSLSS